MVATIRPATRADLPGVGRALARAFFDDPIISWLQPDDGKRRKRGPGFFTGAARIDMEKGGVWTTDDHAGAAMWAAPKRWRDTPRQLLRQAPQMRMLGRHVRRGMRLMSMMEEHHPREPHWYLAVLGTDPDHQGKGIGSQLMAPVLARCDDEGIPAYLESSKQSNIAFYERHGFRVTGELVVSGDGPTLYPMWRDPRPPE